MQAGNRGRMFGETANPLVVDQPCLRELSFAQEHDALDAIQYGQPVYDFFNGVGMQGRHTIGSEIDSRDLVAPDCTPHYEATGFRSQM